MRRLLALGLFLSASICGAQVAPNNIVAAQFGQFQVQSAQDGFSFPPSACIVQAANKSFAAFSVGVPVKIVDQNSANTEVAIPTSVSITGCYVGLNTTHPHTQFYLTSGTGGLQEAITNGGIIGVPNTVILDSAWYALISPLSAATVIASVKGSTSIGIVDQTQSPYVSYTWNGSAYVAASTPNAPFPGSQGLVFNTSASASRNATAADINTLLGFTPLPTANPTATGLFTSPSVKVSGLGTSTLAVCGNGVDGTLTTVGCTAPAGTAPFTGTTGVVFNTSTTASRNATGADIVPLLASQSVTVAGLKDTALTTGTSPICPNGTGGTFTTSGCAAGGASTPATTNILKGNGSANGVVAAAGSDVAGAIGGQNITPSEIGNVYQVSGFPASCTTNEGSFSNQMECAWFLTYDHAVANSSNDTLKMGPGYYPVAHSLYEPTTNFTGISLEGPQGGYQGATIYPTATLTDAVIYKNETNGGATVPFLSFRDFKIAGADLAQGCMRIWGAQNPVFSNINCNGIPNGAPFFYQFAEPNNFAQGGIVGGNFYNIISGNDSLSYPTTYATLTPTVSGGALSLTVTSGGAGYVNNAESIPYVMVLGNRSGTSNTPCSTMGTVSVTLSGSAIATATASGFSGCSGTIHVVAINASNIAVNIDDWTSDSSWAWVDPGGGLLGIDAHATNNTFYHAHPTNIPVGIKIESNDVFTDTEVDTIYKYGFDIENGSTAGAMILGTNTFGNNGSSFCMYNMTSNASVIYGPQTDLQVGSQTPSDWQEFCSPLGTINSSADYLAGKAPAKMMVIGNDLIAATAGDFIPNLAVTNLKVNAVAGNGFLTFTDPYQINFASPVGLNAGTYFGADALIQGPASSSGSNKSSSNFKLQATYYNGGNQFDTIALTAVPLDNTTNPPVSLKFSSSGSSGNHYVDFSALKGEQLPVFTVSTLPAGVPANTVVVVNDASTFTPGACAGGGSDTMLAIYNGSSWSCH